MLIEGQPPEPLRNSGMRWWLVSISIDSEPPDSVLSDLSEDELDHLHTLQRCSDRARYACVRSTLRRLLAVRIGIGVQDIVMTRSDTGKPRLAGTTPPWTFNVSHSGAWGAIAIAPASACLDLGIDIEQCRPLAALSIAETAFSAREVAELARINQPAERTDRFYVLWTIREAYAKALAIGIADTRLRTTNFTADTGMTWRADSDASTRVWLLPIPSHLARPQPYRLALAVTPHAQVRSPRLSPSRFA